MEVMRKMTAKEILNLIDWLRAQGFNNDKIILYQENASIINMKAKPYKKRTLLFLKQKLIK